MSGADWASAPRAALPNAKRATISSRVWRRAQERCCILLRIARPKRGRRSRSASFELRGRCRVRAQGCFVNVRKLSVGRGSRSFFLRDGAALATTTVRDRVELVAKSRNVGAKRVFARVHAKEKHGGEDREIPMHDF